MHKMMIHRAYPREKRPIHSKIRALRTKSRKFDHGSMGEISSNGIETFYESNCVLCSKDSAILSK